MVDTGETLTRSFSATNLGITSRRMVFMISNWVAVRSSTSVSLTNTLARLGVRRSSSPTITTV